ncbi:uroporphyrinogen-III decarboxylase [Paenibacillus sp. 19GGS1-52]|uniref:uroporphyrinogen decarboxylase family protein n=1 Tax=Paenibacillus sp. 19GGS1-52 TaxID=2758563 RepID=UPI001EFB2785|nr:uroporphyrinogen decarboxylase family protein [Paenibacillus sp. 19GGS1-52]ULO06560.1 uroporphyrinogen-III decarboxylase [Paenibacillus sp. 19GGS1-52]
MGDWSKQERFAALLSGERADRPIVSGWRHFLDKEGNAKDLADITVAYTKQFQLDWVKINPRATYYAEAWGNTYDCEDYQSVFPKQTRAVIEKPQDVWDIQVQQAANAAPLAEQLEAVSLIRQGLPDTPLVQTIFSPLTVLLFLAGQSAYVTDTIYGSNQPVPIRTLLTEQRAGVHHALHAIALTLANYVQELGKRGMDGIFYAVTGTAHPDMFTETAFNEFSRPYDAIVLEAADYGKRILHTCGAKSHPERFNDYPIEGISWDMGASGNPGLNAELKPTKVGGVDHALFAGNEFGRIRSQAEFALRIMADEPFILSPNCAIPVTVQDQSLHALHDSIYEKGLN